MPAALGLTQPGGLTHFNVLLVSPMSGGMNRMLTRAVHAALAAEFASGLHALALTLRTPEEYASAS